MSGIATAARTMVDAVEAVDPSVRVACTRKSFPGSRRLSQIAVTAGGAILHRAGLSETILVFPEHRIFLGDFPLQEVAAKLRARSPEKKIVVEVASVVDARAAIDAGFDVVQLEKLSPGDVSVVAAHAQAAQTQPLIAVAGGVNADNAADYVRAGAGLIVSSWPYTARPSDVAVSIERSGH